MKKFIIGITVFILVLFILAYGVLFTQPGNNLLKPTVESRINSALKTKMTLEQFSLRPSYLFIKLKTPEGSAFVLGGKFGLFSKKIDVKYLLSVSQKENRFKFNNLELKGPFWIKGTIQGSMKKVLLVRGKSNFAKSNISYDIKIKNKKPSLVAVKIDALKLANLLRVLHKPAFADATIKADIKLTSFEKNAMKGNGNVYIVGGVVNRNVMRKIYKINLPKTTFKAKTNIVLNGSFINFSFTANSNLGKSNLKGTYTQNKNTVDASYDINILQLALLKPVTNLDLRGSFSTNGTIGGNKALMIIKGASNVADSKTSYKIILKDSNIKNIELLTKNARLDKLLAMLNKPIYAYGLVNANIKMKSIKPDNLKGIIASNISRGVVNSAVIKKLFGINMPKTAFTADINSQITHSVATSTVKINSSVASLTTKKTVFNIPKFQLNSDYKLRIPNLDRLYFITNRHMRGSSTITGDVSYSKNGLKATAFSKMWGGDINIKLANNKLTGEAKNISVVKLTDMMMYNRIFDSRGRVEFNYNLLNKKGTLKALFLNGHILPNRVSFLLHNMANFDITKEIYKTTKLYSKIDNKKVFSDLDMVSRLTHITSKNAFIDLNRNFINAKIRVGIKKSAVYVKLKGNISHPRIKIDFKNLIKHKAKKKIKKLLQGIFK